VAVKVANQTLLLAEARVRAISASTAVAGTDYVLLDTSGIADGLYETTSTPGQV
jgi:hypothetical protein